MFGRKKKITDPEEYIKGKQEEMVRLVKSTFDKAKWEYSFKPENNLLISGFQGDDLPIHLAIAVNDISVHFICHLDFIAEPDKFKEVCWALNEINKSLSFGSFYLDPEDGQITFAYGMVFVESNYTEDTLAGIIRMIVETVDRHDGDLEKIAKKAPSADVSNPMFG